MGDVTDGMTNGVYGTVSNIVCSSTQPHVVKAIFAVFDSENVGGTAQQRSKNARINPNAVPITRIQVAFLVKGRKSFQASRTGMGIDNSQSTGNDC